MLLVSGVQHSDSDIHVYILYIYIYVYVYFLVQVVFLIDLLLACPKYSFGFFCNISRKSLD